MTRSRVVVGAVSATVAALVALGLPAGASHTNQQDPNDTAGRLDVKVVRFDHSGGAPRWHFVTFGPWTVRQVWDRGYLVVQLDTKGDDAVDYVAVVRSSGQQLVADLFKLQRDGAQVKIAALVEEKNGSRGASVGVALRKLTVGANRTSYFWSALTAFTGPACTRTCLDRIPDEGTIEQTLPGVSPTPTPTPTPSPTASPTG